MDGYEDMISRGDTKCGVIGKWAVRIHSGRNATLSVAVDRSEDAEALRALQRSLKETDSRIGCLWAKGQVTFYWPAETSGDGAEEKRVRACLDALDRVGAEPDAVCPLCSAGGCDAAALVDGVYRPVHERCAQERAAKAGQSAWEDGESGRYALGVLGAVLGALVGTVPGAAVSVYVGEVISPLAVLIPLCAYHGCRLLRGRAGRLSLLMSLLLSPVGVIAMGWERVAAQLYARTRGADIQTLLRHMEIYMRRAERWMYVLRESHQELLWAAVGLLGVWSINRVYGRQTRAAREAREFLMPYPAGRRPLL